METLTLLFVVALPALCFLGLWLVLRRWGSRHDPMGGEPGRWWRSTGTTPRVPGDDE